jgi:hypothetical protein
MYLTRLTDGEKSAVVCTVRERDTRRTRLKVGDEERLLTAADVMSGKLCHILATAS